MTTPFRVLSLPSLAALALLSAPLPGQPLHIPAQYSTIQAAIDAAPVSGAEVVVRGGPYAIGTPIDTRDKALTLRAWGWVELNGGGVSRLFHIRNGEGPGTIIQGFFLEDGQAPVRAALGIGDGGSGALIQNGSSPRFLDCLFRNCRADNGVGGYRGGHGGAVYIQGASPSFERCTFNSNRAGNGGTGATGSQGSHGTSVTNGSGGPGGTRFPGGRGGDGGAVFVEGNSDPLFQNCNFIYNFPGLGGNGGFGGRGGTAFYWAGSYFGNGGAGGRGGSSGGAGNAALRVEGGLAAGRVINRTFYRNKISDGGQGGSGGLGGRGFYDGPNGSRGPSGGPTNHPGASVVAAVAITSCAFWNDVTIWGTSTASYTEDVVGTVPRFSASQHTLHGFGSFQLSSNPFEAGDFRPRAGGELIDRADQTALPASATLDGFGGLRRIDHFGVGGVLDIGSLENRTGQMMDYHCFVNPANSMSLVGGQIAIGHSFTVRLTDPTGSIGPGSVAAVAVNSGGGAACNPIPGLGLIPGQAGALLVANFDVIGTASYSGGPTDFTLSEPNTPFFVGTYFYMQGAYIDPAQNNIGLTRGLAGLLGDH